MRILFEVVQTVVVTVSWSRWEHFDGRNNAELHRQQQKDQKSPCFNLYHLYYLFNYWLFSFGSFLPFPRENSTPFNVFVVLHKISTNCCDTKLYHYHHHKRSSSRIGVLNEMSLMYGLLFSLSVCLILYQQLEFKWAMSSLTICYLFKIYLWFRNFFSPFTLWFVIND